MTAVRHKHMLPTDLHNYCECNKQMVGQSIHCNQHLLNISDSYNTTMKSEIEKSEEKPRTMNGGIHIHTLDSNIHNLEHIIH